MRLFLALALCLAAALPASAQVWVESGGNSCEAACGRSGMSPMASGVYWTGEPFYMCAANPGGEGFRGGYNLGRNAGSCTVGYDGRETPVSPYSCMCAGAGVAGPIPGGGYNSGFSSGSNPGAGAGYAQQNTLSLFGDDDDDEIIVEDASVGANCGLPRGNATAHVRRHCGGYERCDYIVDRNLFGGGTNPQCVEDFSVTYSCGSRRQRVATVADVSNQVTVPISCE